MLQMDGIAGAPSYPWAGGMPWRHLFLLQHTLPDTSLSSPEVDSLPYCYRAFGLTIRSEIELTDLWPAPPEQEADLVIRYGCVSRDSGQAVGQDPRLELVGEDLRLLLDEEAGARFLVRGGKEILVEPVRTDISDALIIFLLGSVMASTLAQRGCLALHASVVADGRGAVAIAGASGAGKSSTSAALVRKHGFRLLTDDLCAITLDPATGRPLVLPGYTRLKLWGDMLRFLGDGPESRTPVIAGMEKYYLPMARDACPDPVPLRAVFLLQAEDGIALSRRPITGMAKIRLLQEQIYRGEYLGSIARWPRLLLPILGRVAETAAVAEIRRPRRQATMDAVVRLLLADQDVPRPRN